MSGQYPEWLIRKKLIDPKLDALGWNFATADQGSLLPYRLEEYETTNSPRLRPYQKQANAEVEQAIADRKREMLQAMATGTGKTFTTVNQVYRLMKSGVAKRVMFLVDRRALAAQAVRAFRSFEAEPG